MKKTNEQVGQLKVDGVPSRLRLKSAQVKPANSAAIELHRGYFGEVQAADKRQRQVEVAAEKDKEREVAMSYQKIGEKLKERFGEGGEVWIVTNWTTEEDYDGRHEKVENLIAVCDNAKNAIVAAKAFYGLDTESEDYEATMFSQDKNSFKINPGRLAMGERRVDADWRSVSAQRVSLGNDNDLKRVVDFLASDRAQTLGEWGRESVEDSEAYFRSEPREPLKPVKITSASPELKVRLAEAAVLLERDWIKGSREIIEAELQDPETVKQAAELAEKNNDLVKLLGQNPNIFTSDLMHRTIVTRKINPEVVRAMISTDAIKSANGIRNLNDLMIKLEGRGLNWEGPIVQNKMNRVLLDATDRIKLTKSGWDKDSLSLRRQIRQTRRAWLETSVNAIQSNPELLEAEMLVALQNKFDGAVDIKLELQDVNPEEVSLGWREDGMWEGRREGGFSIYRQTPCEINVATVTLGTSLGIEKWNVVVSPDKFHRKYNDSNPYFWSMMVERDEATSLSNLSRHDDQASGLDICQFHTDIDEARKIVDGVVSKYLLAWWNDSYVCVLPGDVKVDLLGYPEEKLSDEQRAKLYEVRSELDRLAGLYDKPESGFGGALKPGTESDKKESILSERINVSGWTNRRSFSMDEEGTLYFCALHCGENCGICDQRVREIGGGLVSSGVEFAEPSRGYYEIKGFTDFDREGCIKAHDSYGQLPLADRAARYLGKAIRSYVEIAK